MDQPDDKAKLLGCARALLARGEAKFSIAMLCTEAGVPRAAFRTHFTGKAALLTALMAPQLQPVAGSGAAQEPGVSSPDAWLERRLRVFERALNALEVRVDTAGRDQARALAALEERLLAVGAPPQHDTAPAVCAPEEAQALQETPKQSTAAPVLPPLEPVRDAFISRAEMADVLQAARSKARPAPEDPAPRNSARLRWLAIGVLSLATLFLCAGLTLGDAARATAADPAGSGIAHRRLAASELARTIALADAGDAQARTALAVAYLRGAGVAGDALAAARWSAAAARDGHPVAQYVLGSLYGQGEGVAADPVRAFDLFAAAAAQGNLKAMHNLAIAYAQGIGTQKDDEKAAQWFARAAIRGYVDSAFDLAVLYERGQGVTQDLKQALTWYGIAALAGDVPAKARAEFLKSQINPAEAKRAAHAALNFVPLPALEAANRLAPL